MSEREAFEAWADAQGWDKSEPFRRQMFAAWNARATYTTQANSSDKSIWNRAFLGKACKAYIVNIPRLRQCASAQGRLARFRKPPSIAALGSIGHEGNLGRSHHLLISL